jgi:hypothetical protein
LNTFSVNIELFGWGAASLILAALFIFSGKVSRSDWTLLGLCAGIFIGHFFYYFSGGPDFGARYWFLMLIPSVVFTFVDWNGFAQCSGPVPAPGR